jgi:NADH dehydrogenase/NADH:ubiquinone oxidoreductase subunit G
LPDAGLSVLAYLDASIAERDGTTTTGEGAVATRDPRVADAVHAIRARLHIMRGEDRQTKRELKLIAKGAGSALVAAQLESIRGNERKAMQILADANSSGGELAMPTSVLLSAMGCVHARVRKHHAAALYYSRAIQAEAAAAVAAAPSSPPKAVGLLGRD